MTEPIGYLNYGWCFLRSAEHLYSDACSRTHFNTFGAAPVTVLVGHAVELMLKAFIWHVSGQPAPRLHDLCRLLELASDRGLTVAWTLQDREALCHLNELVGIPPYKARYLKTGAEREAPFEYWFKLCRTLMDQIEPKLAAARVGNFGLRTRLEPTPVFETRPPSHSLGEAAELIAELLRKEEEQ